MSIRFRHPETLRLALTRGDWILVKKHLTAGETRRVFRRMIRQGATGDEIDSLQVGLSKMIVYLLDWSFHDADGNPVVHPWPIRCGHSRLARNCRSTPSPKC